MSENNYPKEEYFSTFGCKNGYWKVPLEGQNQDLTTFLCKLGKFRYTRAPARVNGGKITIRDVVVPGTLVMAYPLVVMITSMVFRLMPILLACVAPYRLSMTT